MVQLLNFHPAIRTFKSDHRATSAIEFALIAPVLILILGGVFTVSNYIRARTTTHTYAREAARGIAIGYMTIADAKRTAELNANRDLRVTVTASIDPATKGDPLDQDVRVTLEIAQAEMARLTPFLNIVTGKVSSTVVMRNTLE